MDQPEPPPPYTPGPPRCVRKVVDGGSRAHLRHCKLQLMRMPKWRPRPEMDTCVVGVGQACGPGAHWLYRVQVH